MNTPICDFVARYAGQNSIRLHMPGHKGVSFLGCEALDITEIPGADSLYDADGIIRDSEQNASGLFGSRTFYSTEGSSHAIRAMLALTCQHARANGSAPLVWAGRNAHSAFLTAAALLDISVEWLYAPDSTYLSCLIRADDLEEKLKAAARLPAAVYVTSPDYLGHQTDIRGLAEVCHKYGVLLLVDNAHGAYLKFLPHSEHPTDLGADLCCDSAHKTLPVLTGGAYLHLSEHAPDFSDKEAKEALRLFGSTSPSYLILQSLDMANRHMAEQLPAQLRTFLPLVAAAKEALTAHGHALVGTEPLKLTIAAKEYGYTGTELALLLARRNIVAEFSDPDYIVLMLTPALGPDAVEALTEALLAVPRRAPITEPMPAFSRPQVKLPIRDAVFSPFEVVPAEQCLGRILARASVGCPPAVPILACGEVIDQNAIECFRHYGITECTVIRE